MAEARVRAVRIPVVDRGREVQVDGDLTVPAGATGVVAFAHGSGSSRHSPRNRLVARALQERGLATLLMDLLTAAEEREEALSGHLRFDIPLLARRLAAATDWLAANESTTGLPVGYFGASTGAAAALAASVGRADVRAIVSRGGRPDLAGAALARVAVPTLLLVGSLDATVLAMNREAGALMPGEVRLEVVPGASHLFEEPGTLDEVARRAGDFLAERLARR